MTREKMRDIFFKPFRFIFFKLLQVSYNLSIKYKLLLIFGVVISLAVVVTSVSIYKMCLNTTIKGTLTLSDAFLQQSIINLESKIRDLDVNCFTLYNNSKLPELLSAINSHDVNNDTILYDEVIEQTLTDLENTEYLTYTPFATVEEKVLDELGKFAYSSLMIESILLMDLDGNSYYLDKRGNMLPKNKITNLHENISSLKKLKGKSKWSFYDGNILIERAVLSSVGLVQEGYISIEIRSNLLRRIIQSGIDEDSMLALFSLDGETVFINSEDENGLFSYVFREHIQKDIDLHKQITYKNRQYLLTAGKESTSEWILVNIIPYDSIFNSWSSLQTAIIRIVFIILLLAFILVLSFSNNVSSKVKILLHRMDDIAICNFYNDISFKTNDEFNQIAVRLNALGLEMDRLIKRIIDEEQSNKVMKIQLLESQFRALQSQINPHFMYNALESISSMALLDNAPKISDAIRSFSGLLRLNVSRNCEKTTLYDETKYVKKYLKLYDIVFPDRIKTKFSIENDTKYISVPSFILQPIIENCIVHCVEESVRKIKITISSYLNDEQAVISIADTGDGLSDKEILKICKSLNETDEKCHKKSGESKSVGLKNVNQRLKLFYGTSSGLRIEHNHPRGLLVYVIVPCRKF